MAVSTTSFKTDKNIVLSSLVIPKPFLGCAIFITFPEFFETGATVMYFGATYTGIVEDSLLTRVSVVKKLLIDGRFAK